MVVKRAKTSPDPVGVLVAAILQSLDEAGPVAALPPLGDLHLPPAAERLEGHEQIGRPVADILAVVAGDLSGASRQGQADLTDQLRAQLVQTHDRASRIER